MERIVSVKNTVVGATDAKGRLFCTKLITR
jgi:hypothetical protein